MLAEGEPVHRMAPGHVAASREPSRGPGGASGMIAPRLVPGPLWGHSAYRLLAAHGREHEWRPASRHRPGGSRLLLRSIQASPASLGGVRQVWHYDPDGPVATLAALRILCPRCDAVCHLGHTGVARGPQAYDRAIRHMARMNRTSTTDELEMVEREWQRWRELSAIGGWRVRVAADLAARMPTLRIVEGDDLDSAATTPGTAQRSTEVLLSPRPHKFDPAHPSICPGFDTAYRREAEVPRG